MDYAITLVAAVLLGIGFVLQQQSAETAPESHFLSPRLFGDLFRKRKWLAGIVCMILGQVLAAWSIGHLALSLVEPLLTTNLLVALILAVPLSHQALGITEVIGALLLIAGETILSLARSIEPIGDSFGSFFWPAAAGIACIAFAAVQAGRHRSGRRRATLTGLGAGLVFGIQDALTRQTLQILQHHGVSGLLHSWSAYCLVATGAVGLLLMQSAFNAGPLHSSLPTITAGEPVAGILLGIVVFGDRISLSPGSLAMHAGGLAALVVGVILVARAPALSNLRKAVVEPVHLPRRRDTGPQRSLPRTPGAIPPPPGPPRPVVAGAPSPAARNGDAGVPLPGEPPLTARNGDAGVPLPGEPPLTARNGDAGVPLPGEPPLTARNGDAGVPLPGEPPLTARNGEPGVTLAPDQPLPPASGDAGFSVPAEPPGRPGDAEFAPPAGPPTPVPPDPPR